MDREIVISGDFSEPGSPLLAGPSEEQLRPTQSCVSPANAKFAALKELGSECSRALVIDHCFDSDRGWVISRKVYRRIGANGVGPAAAADPGESK